MIKQKIDNIEFKLREYQELMEQYYPIDLIIYGIKNNNLDFIKEGRKEIKNRINN